MYEKPSDNIILIKKGSILVKNLDEMIKLLDKNWVVEEEIDRDSFIMRKNPSARDLEARLS